MRKYLPALVALADTIAIVSYVIGVNPAFFQGAALAVKLLLIPFLLRRDSVLVQQLPLFFVLAACCVLSLTFSRFPNPGAVLQITAFLSHLGLTLLLISAEMPLYLAAVAVAITATNLLYLAMAAVGRIPTMWGRHQYFGGAEPNLGAEIAAMSAVCAAMTLTLPWFMAIALPALLVAGLTQGRSAILAIAVSIMLKLGRFLYSGGLNAKVRLWILAAAPLVIAGVVASIPSLIASLLLDDKDRGIGAGVSGRADLWLTAWHFFRDSPMTGIGLGSYGTLKLLPPHNFVLYALAEMGLLAVPVFATIGYLAARCYRQHGWIALYVIALVPLLMFNARLFNLNIYPFCFFVIIFSLSVPSVRAVPSALPAAGDRAAPRRAMA